MKENLLELVETLIAENQKELDFFNSIGSETQIEYYTGKIAAYRIIRDYATV